MTLTDICKRVGIHKSKGYSILNTIRNFGFVQRDARSKTYSLGPGLLFLSSKILDNLDFREVVAPLLYKLSSETDSTAFFGLVWSDHLFVVAKDEGGQDIGMTIRLGHRFPLAWGAHGKSIVAFLSESERQNVLKREKLHFHGDPSRFEPERLEQELAVCRRVGFAVDLGEMKIGIHAVAAPVFGPSGKLIGSLVVMGTFPKALAKEYGSTVSKAARKFSSLIGGFSQMSDAGSELNR
jgi:DNA-binding IclR family transcriptional regulator